LIREQSNRASTAPLLKRSPGEYGIEAMRADTATETSASRAALITPRAVTVSDGALTCGITAAPATGAQTPKKAAHRREDIWIIVLIVH